MLRKGNPRAPIRSQTLKTFCLLVLMALRRPPKDMQNYQNILDLTC